MALKRKVRGRKRSNLSLLFKSLILEDNLSEIIKLVSTS